MADANAVIKALGFQLAQAIIDKTIAEVEVAELRERVAALDALGDAQARTVAAVETAG